VPFPSLSRASSRSSSRTRASDQDAAAMSPARQLQQRRYRDLHVFEQRLRANAARHQRRWYKYETAMIVLVVVVLVLGYFAWFSPREDPVLHRALIALFFSAFFGTVYLAYSDPFIESSKFLAQCNRALGPFHLRMARIRGEDHRLLFHRSVPTRFQEGYAEFRYEYDQRRRAGSVKSTTTT